MPLAGEVGDSDDFQFQLLAAVADSHRVPDMLAQLPGDFRRQDDSLAVGIVGPGEF